MTKKFCIKHQKFVNTSPELGFGDGHIAALFAPDWGWCEGPFATSEPPILPKNWIDLVTEPSAEELEQMDANAEELLLEVA